MKDFKQDFMKVVRSKDKKLFKFGKEHFYLNTEDSQKEFDDFNENVDSLKELTVEEKRLAKARLKQFEEDNDISKTLPSSIAIIAALLIFIRFIVSFEFNGPWASILIVIVAISLLIISVSTTLYRGRNYRRLAIYLNSLLEENLKYEQKESKVESDS